MKKGEMLSKMLVIATNAHAGQFDKAGKPYILHPLRVMSFIKEDDEELQCMGVGHDLFEDTSVTKQFLREHGISERVIAGVWCMTKLPGETYEEYKEKVFSNADSMIVKSADLRHNSDIRRLKGVTEKDFLRTAKYMQFYTEIQNRLMLLKRDKPID